MNYPFRFPRLTLLGIVLLPVACCVQAADTPDSAPRVIRTFGDYWNIPAESKDRPHPVRMEVITYYSDPEWKQWWGEVDGAPGYLPITEGVALASGKRCLIEGSVVPARGFEAELIRITVLREQVPLAARPLPEGLAETEERAAALSGRMVVVEAYVTQHETVDHHRGLLTLAMDGYRLSVRVLGNSSNIAEMTHRRIRARGVFIPDLDPAGNLLSASLWVPSPANVEVLGRLDRDPRFHVPATPIEDLGQVDPQSLVRVAGTVQSYDAGRNMVIRDGTGQAQFAISQVDAIRPGDLVEAIGFPSARGLDWRLRGVIFRRLAAGGGPHPVTIVDRLRFIDQIQALSRAEAARSYPVRIWGVVSWSGPGRDFFFLRDASGGIRVVRPPGDTGLLNVGTAVTVTGVTAAGTYAPIIKLTEVQPTDSRLPNDALPVTADRALSGIYQDTRIELKAFLAAVSDDGPWTRLSLRTPDGEIDARVAADERIHALVGSVVRVKGICEAVANDQHQLAGIQLWLGSFADVQVEAVMPADPFSVESHSINSLRQFSAVHLRDRWTKTSGVVTSFLAGDSLTIQDGADGLLVLTQQTDPLRPGDVVEVVGLPTFDGRNLVFGESIYRQIDRGATVPARELLSAGRIEEPSHNLLVNLTGRLLDVAAEGGEVRLSVESNDRIFSAVLNSETTAPESWATLPGSLVHLTGVYVVETNTLRRTRDFHLLLRSQDDVVVLKTAPWWTPRRALSIAGILGVFLAIGIWRVLKLSGRVEQQSAHIENQAATETHLRARNQQIVTRASDAIFTTGADGCITSFNPAGERITGHREAELVGSEIGSLLVAPDPAIAFPGPDQPVTGFDGTTHQCLFRKRDDTEIWVEISWNQIISDSGEPCLLAIMRDISARKEFEDGLTRARDAAEANAAAKSMFLANMSHELRTPMNGVIGMSNLLLDTRLDEEQREFARTVRNSAESLLTVLNDILDFSKIEAGKLSLEILDFDAHEVVGETVELLAPRAAAKDIELATHLASALPRSLRGDPGRLRQVLLNLLGNAIKFTERGEISITAAVTAEDAAGVKVRFEVRDTGVGLEPAAVERLFRPFSQADNSTTRRYGGTGLGLAISKQIVELMSGTIGIESTLGEGSTFWFEAPFCLGAPPSVVPVRIPSGLRLLVLDGNETRRRMLRDYAASWQAQIEFCDEPSTAGMKLDATPAPFDLFAIDGELRDFDRVGFFQENAPLLGTTRVILFESLFERKPPTEIAGVRIDATVNKPVSVDEVSRAVARVSGGGDAAENSAPAAPQTSAACGSTAPLPLRLLVAEDNVVNQRVITLWLKKIGYSADVVANGLEVLEALERKDYDVVLMDCQMPEMDGYQATRRIRANADHRSLRIIAMTANAMQGDREKCLAAGMDDYLSKPYKIDDLRAALLRCAHQPADRR